MLKLVDILDEKESVLHKVSTEVSFPLDKKYLDLIDDAYEYLRLSQDDKKCEELDLRPGMGLAFCQLGVLKRIFIISYSI